MMKKILSILLSVLLLFICLVACNEENTQEIQLAEEVEKTPIEQLTEDEKNLFDALIKASAEFYEPSEVRILEVGDYRKKGYYSDNDIINHNPFLGNGIYEEVKVRIQGENRVGGTLNHYYVIRLKTDPDSIVEDPQKIIGDEAESSCKIKWDLCKENEFPKSSFDSRREYKDFLIQKNHRYCTEEESVNYFGECAEIDDSISTSAEDMFNIAKINKALKYYWDDKLGNY